MYGGCHHRGNYVFAIVVVDRLILSPYNTIKSHIMAYSKPGIHAYPTAHAAKK